MPARKNHYFTVYHSVFDYHLTPNAIKVYVCLDDWANCLRYTTPRIQVIAAACGIQSLATVHAALAELQRKGLITKHRRKNAGGHYIANGYFIKQLHGKWFVLPKQCSPLLLPKAAFASYLYLLKCKNKRNKAFPSISAMAKVLVLAKNTVIAALKELAQLMLIKKAPLWAGKHNLYYVYAYQPAEGKKIGSTVGTPYYPNGSKNHQNYKSIIVAALRLVKRIRVKANSIPGKLHYFLSWVVQKLNSSTKNHPKTLQ